MKGKVYGVILVLCIFLSSVIALAMPTAFTRGTEIRNEERQNLETREIVHARIGSGQAEAEWRTAQIRNPKNTHEEIRTVARRIAEGDKLILESQKTQCHSARYDVVSADTFGCATALQERDDKTVTLYTGKGKNNAQVDVNFDTTRINNKERVIVRLDHTFDFPTQQSFTVYYKEGNVWRYLQTLKANVKDIDVTGLPAINDGQLELRIEGASREGAGQWTINSIALVTARNQEENTQDLLGGPSVPPFGSKPGDKDPPGTIVNGPEEAIMKDGVIIQKPGTDTPVPPTPEEGPAADGGSTLTTSTPLQTASVPSGSNAETTQAPIGESNDGGNELITPLESAPPQPEGIQAPTGFSIVDLGNKIKTNPWSAAGVFILVVVILGTLYLKVVKKK